MNREWLRRTSLIAQLLILSAQPVLAARTSSGSRNDFATSLNGYGEVPPNFTTGSGTCQLTISSDASSISYKLAYSGLSSAVTQAHIHFAQRPVNGGIMVYLCDNTGKAPAGVPACPDSGMVTGTLTSTDVNPPNDPEPVTAQGISPGDFAGLVGAIQNGDSYCNVHTSDFPAGEIRGYLPSQP
jgi:hypothetical protein